MLKTSGIEKSFNNVHVLKNVSVEIESKKLVCIVGPSGAGKTTLLQIIGTLDKPDKGNVFFKGQDIVSLSGNKLAKFRNQQIGFIFQFHHLLPEFNAIENVCIPAFINGTKKSVAEERAKFLLDSFGLSHRFTHKPSELSGGEQQRIAVARALMNDPDLILADEPTGNLDTKNATDLHELFFKLKEDFGKTLLIVTHNEKLAEMADKVIHMKDGQVVNP